MKAADVVSPDTLLSMSGLDFLNDIIDCSLPPPPMAVTLGFHLAEAVHGRVVFEGAPEFLHYNPIGSVQSSFSATLLDSALRCSIFSTRAKGEPGPRWS